MPIVFVEKTRCAISNKIITDSDYVMGFYAFPYYEPPHPLSVCYDNVALRDEFNKWEFREAVTEELSKIWTQRYGKSDAYQTVIFKDDSYIIAKGTIDANVRIWFLKHIFTLTVSKVDWKAFCQTLLDDQKEISFDLHKDSHLLVRKENEGVKIYYDRLRDRIKLDFLEWHYFLSILAMNQNL